MSREFVEIQYDEIVAQTDKAVCLLIEDGKHWIPWSQIEDNGKLDGMVWVTKWIAEQKGIC